MSKRLSDVERITGWFSAADPMEATVLFQVIRGILTQRNIDTGKRKASTKPRKHKGTSASSLPARDAGTQTQGNALAAGN